MNLKKVILLTAVIVAAVILSACSIDLSVKDHSTYSGDGTSGPYGAILTINNYIGTNITYIYLTKNSKPEKPVTEDLLSPNNVIMGYKTFTIYGIPAVNEKRNVLLIFSNDLTGNVLYQNEPDGFNFANYNYTITVLPRQEQIAEIPRSAANSDTIVSDAGEYRVIIEAKPRI